MRKDLAVIIPWADRDEIKTTLGENLKLFLSQEISVEVIIVNCGGDFTNLNVLLAQFQMAQLVLVDVGFERFNKSLALNKGINRANANFFMCLDADIILENFDFRQAFRKIDLGYFVTLKNISESESETNPLSQLSFEINGITAFSYKIDFEKQDGTHVEIALNRQDLYLNTRSAPGIIIAGLNDIIAIGGYNSNLEGWGWEDIDLIARLEFYGRNRTELGSAIHLTHSDDIRHLDPDARSKSENEAYNLQKCLINYQLGLFMGTLTQDI